MVRNVTNIFGKFGFLNKRPPAQLSYNHKKLPHNKTPTYPGRPAQDDTRQYLKDVSERK